MGIDVVIESTGVFTKEEQARLHIAAGATRVIISAPTESAGVSTVLVGVNDDTISGKEIISNASCTTNSAAPVAAVIEKTFGIESALLTTVHAYTATQSLVDGPATKDVQRGRAAGLNIVPSTTGAAIAATKALPSLHGKFDGVALRVPVPVVSITDFTFLVNKKVTREEVNAAIMAAVDDPAYKGVLAVTHEPTVSTDFIGDPHSAIVDTSLTLVMGKLVKVMAWYDNEWGYANRLVEQVIGMGR
jgi:glyceraldehyde 3-phosphate dehydrogenase